MGGSIGESMVLLDVRSDVEREDRGGVEGSVIVVVGGAP